MEETMPLTLRHSRRPEQSAPATSFVSQLPESPRAPMEFLSRSWSASALQVSKALAPTNSNINTSHNVVSGGNIGICMAMSSSSKSSNRSSTCTNGSIVEDIAGESDEVPMLAGNQFSFASSATSQLVLDRIMSQSMRDLDVSPLTSGRLSHSSGPLNCGSLTETDSPPISPDEDFDDVVKFFSSNNTIQPLFNTTRATAGPTAANNNNGGGGGGAKTVGRWLKDRKERKKEETRAQNAQIHAAVSVAAVASAVAAIAAATAASSASGKNEQSAKTDAAVASAATLVAAQCAEAAESVGADRDHLASVVSSAVNVRSYDDIITLTAAAATALRGVATLKARTSKEVWNIAAVIPVEKGMGLGVCGKANAEQLGSGFSGELWATQDNNSAGFFNQDILARGTELLKRTRKGDLHWKIVSVYIHRTGQVMLKMKSKHVAGTITKKKKNVVLEVCKDVAAWPGRHLFDGGEQRSYFGLKTENRGLVEFECKNQTDYELWTRGVSNLLSIVSERRNRR